MREDEILKDVGNIPFHAQDHFCPAGNHMELLRDSVQITDEHLPDGLRTLGDRAKSHRQWSRKPHESIKNSLVCRDVAPLRTQPEVLDVTDDGRDSSFADGIDACVSDAGRLVL